MVPIGEQIGEQKVPKREHKNERTHSAKTDNKRRSFGTIRTVTKRGPQYLEASYLAPAYALAENPQLPKRYTKTVEKEFVAELEVWLAEAQKQIKLNAWTPPTRLNKKELDVQTMTFAEPADMYMCNIRKPNNSTNKPPH